MITDQKEKCLQAYYRTDIEPTLDRLNQIKDIVSNFERMEQIASLVHSK